MNVYFAGSIRGGRTDVELYHRIISYIKKTNVVITEHVGDFNLQEKISDKEIFTRDTVWLRRSDIVIAECTSPSFGVGYELAYAERYNKPVHVFFRKGNCISAMFTGNPHFVIHPYTDETEIYTVLDRILEG